MPNVDRKISVLLVDDEPLISLDLCDTLSEAGYLVIGPASTISAALALLDRQRPQLAVIDVKFRDGVCLELARELRQRGVPFIVHTGYPPDGSDAIEFRDAPRLTKPASPPDLLKALSQLSASPVQNGLPRSVPDKTASRALMFGTTR